jgi:hypothetical protein
MLLMFSIVRHDSTLQTDEYGENINLDTLKGEIDFLDYDNDLFQVNYEKVRIYRDNLKLSTE